MPTLSSHREVTVGNDFWWETRGLVTEPVLSDPDFCLHCDTVGLETLIQRLPKPGLGAVGNIWRISFFSI